MPKKNYRRKNIASNIHEPPILPLFNEVKSFIEQAKKHVKHTINSAQVLLNWHIGNSINQFILKNARAGYGEKIYENLSDQLQLAGYKGYSAVMLRRTVKLVKVFPDLQILSSLVTKLSWTAFIVLLYIEDPLKREFYIQMCSIENWSVRELRAKIDSLFYERTALAKSPEKVILKEIKNLRKHKTSESITFKDPYILDFLDLPAMHSEENLESAILNEIEQFIKELGNDFCFVTRQKRMSTEGGTDRYLDLLFFHRGLQRLIAIELKQCKFQPEHKGQMEWYLRWLDKYERKAHEDKPLGIILCSDKDNSDIELLELDKSGIHIAQYILELPSRKVFEEKLKLAIETARKKLLR
jgi:predicted nuclease of restriction endonuclease-like (RecB) superfamily